MSGVRLEQENARLAAENTRLARTIDRLQHDPVLIQDLIRQELNFVKKNEIIFQFPPEKPAVAPINLGQRQRRSGVGSGSGYFCQKRRKVSMGFSVSGRSWEQTGQPPAAMSPPYRASETITLRVGRGF